jgi:two-component system, NarL family, nitrate/nitrite response regulator NarL
MSSRTRKAANPSVPQRLSPEETKRTPLAEGASDRDDWDEAGKAGMREVSPIRVRLMCDHPIEREGIGRLIANQPGMVVASSTGVTPEQPGGSDKAADIILVDLDSDKPDALTLLPRVVAAAGRGRVLVLTSADKERVMRHFAFLGAMGVVSRDQGVEILVKAIMKVHSGEIWFERTVLASLIRQIAQPVRQPCDEEAALRISGLTRREREVIQLLGQGMNAEALAKQLFISETTARHHLTSTFEKLGIRDRFDLVFYAYRHRLAVPPALWELSNSA